MKPLDDYFPRTDRPAHYQNRDELVQTIMELKRKVQILQKRIDDLFDENMRLKAGDGGK